MHVIVRTDIVLVFSQVLFVVTNKGRQFIESHFLYK
jgi:hypothetical protein